MNRPSTRLTLQLRSRLMLLLVAGAMAALAAGCASLLPKAPAPPTYYALDGALAPARAPSHGAAPPLSTRPTLTINPPHAAAGADSAHMIYVRQAHRLDHYANSVWVDTPARMSAPLIVAALERSAAWRAVVLTPSAAAGELRLDTEILRLQHDFTRAPSRVRLTLRATLVDTSTRRVLAWREFDETAAAPSEDAYGGVVAANVALHAVLASLLVFCEDATSRWQPPPPTPPPQPQPRP